ncbi:LADA_0D02960g1_1 [Lachancea dasiensis]|uniref:LADA_0D02960g1_1 n=1 Tax=Lachancea dasiensis TaxID=1072105 RepID=A0A1G4J4D6_9SACH|nr:LADA_0D02960g1_1 [Lachancea dasiensis]
MPQSIIRGINLRNEIKGFSSSVLGIGTDVVYLPRFQRLILKYGSPGDGKRLDRIMSKFMHARELSRYQELLQNHKSSLPLIHYAAGVWATKEAIYKTLASQVPVNMMPPAQTIYTKLCYKLNGSTGAPKIEIDDTLMTKYPKFMLENIINTKFLVSLSHDEKYLVSFVCQSKIGPPEIAKNCPK